MNIDAARTVFNSRWPAGRAVATTKQLVAAGLNERIIGGAVRAGILHRLRRGVYAPMKAWAGLPPWDQDKLVLSGHIVATAGQHVYSHFSAARLHELHLWNSSRAIHVVAPYGASPSPGVGDVVVHRDLMKPEKLVHRYIPGTGLATFTTLELTVIQCALSASFEQAVVIGDSAFHKGLDMQGLEAILIKFVHVKGIKRARAVVKALNRLAESAGESRTRLIIAQLPIEQPELQVQLDTHTGKYPVDFAWRGIKLILEFDGNSKFSGYAQPTKQALIDERERENALIELGWRFIRIKWKHLANPESLKARIMDAYLAATQAAA